MSLKKFDVEKYQKLPDKAGAIYDEIEEFRPKSYIYLEKQIRSFLDYKYETDTKNKPPISAEMLIAPWGIGKTTTHDKMIKKLISEDYEDGYSIKITAQEISYAYDNLTTTDEFKELENDADRFLLVLAKVISKKSEFKQEFDDIEYLEILRFLQKIQEKHSFFLIFIDELEEVIKNKNDIVVFILKALKSLLNGTSNIINQIENPDLVHFLLFLLACTDSAFYEISRHDKLMYEYGGISRRIKRKDILGISLFESIEYLLKLNKFSYNGKFVKSFVNLGASFNTIARMAMKNPGYMKSFYHELMGSTDEGEKPNTIQKIDGDFIILKSKGFNLEYMEAQRNAISDEVYLNWFRKFKSKKLAINLIKLLLGEIKVFSIEEIVDRFEPKPQKNEILKSIGEINQYINLIHSNIKQAIIPVNLFKNEITAADIENFLNYSDNPVEIEKRERVIRFREGDILFEKFIETISFYEIKDNEEINEIFFFSKDPEIIQELFPYLDPITIKLLKLQFEKLIDTEKDDCYIINPGIFDIVFPLPIPPQYNIIINKDINISLWSDISRTKKSEIFKDRICEIFADFLIYESYLLEDKKLESELKKVDSFSYYRNELDKEKFIILMDYRINELSNNPINIMVWRELGDYDESVINSIMSNVSLFQDEESKNIHLVILISQTKISKELIEILSNNVEYSVIQSITLSQFDITKYAFLNKVKDMKEGDDYDKEKFNDALKNLLNPFKSVIEDSKRVIDSKGLDIKLKKLPSTLATIPQLLKYVIYDFQSDFNNWISVELKKPYEKINPVGLSPRYSSSIDDWGQNKLRNTIEEFLQINKFVQIENDSLEIIMPKIEENILQLIKRFSKKTIFLKIEDVEHFFYETTDSPALLKDVLIADLENRGLFEINSDGFIVLYERNDELMKEKLDDIRRVIRTLKIGDLNFYHIYTFKKYGFSIIFLNDFLDTLELLFDLNRNADVNDKTILTRQVLFLRIFKVFEGIINHIFIPLDVKVSDFKSKLEEEIKDHIYQDYINSKLADFGFKEIDLERFAEIEEINTLFNDVAETLENPINRGNVRNIASAYQRKHANDVNSSDESFSFHRLDQNKLEKDFDSPFLNLIYNELLDTRDKILNSRTFTTIEIIKKTIEDINANYVNIQASVREGSFNGKLAPLIFEKIKTFSKFEFFKTERIAANLNQIKEILDNLNKEIDEKIVQLNLLLTINRRAGQLNLLDKISFAEISIESNKSDIENNVKYLIDKKIIEKEDNIDGYSKIKEELDISTLIEKVENCDNLYDLHQVANDIFTTLNIRKDTFSTIVERIIKATVYYFTNWRDISSLQRLFETFGYKGYAEHCDKYKNQLKRLNLDLPLKTVSDDLLSFQARIEQGYQTLLKEKIPEDKLIFFLDLYDKFIKKNNFTEKQFIELGKKHNLTAEQSKQLLKNLIDKGLILQIYSFK